MSTPLASWLPNPVCCNVDNPDYLCPECLRKLNRKLLSMNNLLSNQRNLVMNEDDAPLVPPTMADIIGNARKVQPSLDDEDDEDEVENGDGDGDEERPLVSPKMEWGTGPMTTKEVSDANRNRIGCNAASDEPLVMPRMEYEPLVKRRPRPAFPPFITEVAPEEEPEE